MVAHPPPRHSHRAPDACHQPHDPDAGVRQREHRHHAVERTRRWKSAALGPRLTDDTHHHQRASREPVWAVARFGPAIARRHFEEASWSEADGDRALVIKSVSVAWTPGPHYEIKVVVDRYEGGRRVGQASGSGYGYPDRTGAAFAGPFGGFVHQNANEAKGDGDGLILRAATVAAFDSAWLQLAAVWAGEQMVKKAQDEAKAMMKKSKK